MRMQDLGFFSAFNIYAHATCYVLHYIFVHVLIGNFILISSQDLWRIGQDLYDFGDFLSTHPGGSDWLELSRGTDITEAFNTSHVFIGRARTLLAKYHVRSCPEIPRRSPYTFKEDGFYSKLRTRAAKVLKSVGTGPTLKLRFMADVLVVLMHLMLVLTAYTGSYLMAVATGIVTGMNLGMGHNFQHQKNNFRRWLT